MDIIKSDSGKLDSEKLDTLKLWYNSLSKSPSVVNILGGFKDKIDKLELKIKRKVILKQILDEESSIEEYKQTD